MIKTYVENFEAGDIQHTDEVNPLESSLQSDVTLLDQPLEGTIEHGLSHGADGGGHLVLVPALGHELVTDLDSGLGQVLVQVHAVNAEQLAEELASLITKECCQTRVTERT